MPEFTLLHEISLDGKFEPIEKSIHEEVDETILHVASEPEKARQNHESRVQTELDTFLTSFKVQSPSLPFMERKANRYQEQLMNSRQTLADLETQKHRQQNGGKERKKPWAYIALYVILLLGAMGMFVLNSELVFAEQHLIVSIITSIVALAPSFLFCQLYKGKMTPAEQESLLRKINIVGVASSFLLLICYAFARGLAFSEMMQVADVSESIFAPTESDWISKAQTFSAIAAFLFGVVCEIFFASSLLIIVSKPIAEVRELQHLKDDIKEIQAKIAKWEAEFDKINEQIEQLKWFAEYSDHWKKHKTQSLMSYFDRQMASARETALRAVMPLIADMRPDQLHLVPVVIDSIANNGSKKLILQGGKTDEIPTEVQPNVNNHDGNGSNNLHLQ